MIPWKGRSPGEEKGYPLQYSGLENSMDCIVHGVTKSRTRLSDFHFTSPKVFTPSLFFSVLFIQTPISFPFLGGDIFSSPPTGVKRLGHEERAGLSMVSFLVSNLEIGRFLGLFYFFYPHTPVLTTGIIYSVRVSGFEINPQWLRAVLHRLCPSLSTHYDCRATNILMIPGTHAKRKTVDLVKTTWCSGDFPGGPVAKTVQQDKLYCAHASSEKSFIHYYKPKHPHGAAATAQRVTDNCGHFVAFLMSWSSGLWESLA